MKFSTYEYVHVPTHVSSDKKEYILCEERKKKKKWRIVPIENMLF